eukprot:scaffold6979_cov77-Skeletonema_marinoi.AAC.3
MGQVPLTGGLSLYPCRIGVGQTWAQSNEEARLSLGAVGTLRNFTTVGQNLTKTKHEHRWNRLLKLHRLLEDFFGVASCSKATLAVISDG